MANLGHDALKAVHNKEYEVIFLGSKKAESREGCNGKNIIDPLLMIKGWVPNPSAIVAFFLLVLRFSSVFHLFLDLRY